MLKEELNWHTLSKFKNKYIKYFLWIPSQLKQIDIDIYNWGRLQHALPEI